MAQVFFPRALAAIIAGLPKQAECQAATVQELITALDERWPGLGLCLCGTHTSLRPHVNVYVDGNRATLATLVQPASVVRVLTAVSGG